MNQAVILAAGASSRFAPLNRRNKSLFMIMGRPLISYTIEGLIKAGARDIIVVEGKGRDIETALREIDFKGGTLRYVVEKEPKGMGDALSAAKDLLEESFFVVNAERTEAGEYIKAILDKKKSAGSELVLMGKEVKNPWLYGILSLEEDRVKGIVEKPERGKEPSKIKAAGIYLLPKGILDYYERTDKGIYSFESALNAYTREKEARAVMAPGDILPLKYPWHLFPVARSLMDNFLKKKISGSAEIDKSAIIKGPVFIGEKAKIYEHAVIKGPCYIGAGAVIGNNAVVREYSDIEAGCVVGANAEITRSILGEGVHMHSGFVGDSVIGRGSKIGAGVITANVRNDRGEIFSLVKGERVATGLDSFGAVIGEETAIGVRCSTMPGVMIGSKCMVGPASVVFRNIEDGSSL